MNLYELVYTVILQGNIRISMWNGDDETILFQEEDVDYFRSSQVKDEWMDYRVTYMFCPGDGYMHIEVTDDEDYIS